MECSEYVLPLPCTFGRLQSIRGAQSRFQLIEKNLMKKNVTRVIVKHAIVVGVMKINYDLDFMYLFLLFRFDNSSYL